MFAFFCRKITNFRNIALWIGGFLNRVEVNDFKVVSSKHVAFIFVNILRLRGKSKFLNPNLGVGG